MSCTGRRHFGSSPAWVGDEGPDIEKRKLRVPTAGHIKQALHHTWQGVEPWTALGLGNRRLGAWPYWKSSNMVSMWSTMSVLWASPAVRASEERPCIIHKANTSVTARSIKVCTPRRKKKQRQLVGVSLIHVLTGLINQWLCLLLHPFLIVVSDVFLVLSPRVVRFSHGRLEREDMGNNGITRTCDMI